MKKDDLSNNDSLIKVSRFVDMTVTRIELNDRITVQLGESSYTATAIKQIDDDMLFCFDTCLSEAYYMNKRNTNNGGYECSDLRGFLQEVTQKLSTSIKKHIVPFENGDLLRIATREEMFGRDDYTGHIYEDLGGYQIPYFKDSKNRIALRNGESEWYWLQNKTVVTLTYFASCNLYGGSGHCRASNSYGVRPLFKIRNR